MRWLALAVVVGGCGGSAAPNTRAGDPVPARAEVRDPLSEASLMADIAWLCAPERAGRGSRTPAARATADWLVAQLRASGYNPVAEQPIPALPGQVNIVAATTMRSGPAIVVMAHYDHLGTIDGAVYPGANDNASGVAVALAVARDVMARHTHDRIVFIFTGGEEVDLLGARAYVARPLMGLGDIRVVYNLDMVGTPLFGNDAQLAAVGLPDDVDIAEAATTAARDAGLSLLAVRPGLLKLLGEDLRSDDWIFRAAGVLAIHFSTGLTDTYHRPTDTPDRLSRAQLGRVARFLRALVATTPPR